jgi:hypothetical protein
MKSGKPNLGDRDLLVQIGSLIQLEIAALQVAKQNTETIIGLSRDLTDENHNLQR